MKNKEIEDLVKTIDIADRHALDLATRLDSRFRSDGIAAVREAVAVARTRIENLTISAGVDLADVRKPALPEIDFYEGWIDYAIEIDGSEIELRSTPEAAERLVEALKKAEIGSSRKLDDDLKQAQINLLKAQLADREPNADPKAAYLSPIEIVMTCRDGKKVTVSPDDYHTAVYQEALYDLKLAEMPERVRRYLTAKKARDAA